jgi:hypothetical protein
MFAFSVFPLIVLVLVLERAVMCTARNNRGTNLHPNYSRPRAGQIRASLEHEDEHEHEDD